MRIRVKRQHLFYGMIFVSFSMIAILTTFLFSPTAGSHADSVNIGVGVNSVISMSLDSSSLMLEAAPNSFVSATIDPTIFTNSSYGYTLRMSAFDSETNMESETVDDKITSSFGGSKTSDNMPSNAWGYSLDGTNYTRIPVEIHAKNISISNGPSPDGGSTAEVRIGAKIGMIPSGTYHGKLIFTAYVNGVDGNPDPDDPNWEGEDEGDPEDDYDTQGNCITTKTIYDINTMQRMTPCICANTTTPAKTALSNVTFKPSDDTSLIPRTVLKDQRDGTKYLISKTYDGNCWMSTNLNMDLTTDMVFTNKLTDLNTKTSWSPNNNTLMITGGTVKYADNMNFPENWSNDGKGITRSARFNEIGAYYRGGETASATPTSEADAYLYERNGVYYNFNAATAGYYEEQSASEQTKDSICPRGWTIPSVAQWDNLFVSYGLRNRAPAYLFMRNAPFNVPRSGSVYTNTYSNGYPIQSISRQRGGQLWAGTLNSNGANTYFNFGDSNQTIFISPNTVTWDARTLRCIAR